MKNNHYFLDVHAIQTLPPSNVNRDDTGSPKTAQYGGVTRARVSSQSWKRAIRQYFNDNGNQRNVGVRTLDIVYYVGTKIMALDGSITAERANTMAEELINNIGIKTKDGKARALFFLGDEQAELLAKAAVEGVTDKALLKSYLQSNPAVDIALFGRMVADDPSLNEDASSQIAHSISTHAVQTEYDFYTALDDLTPEDQAGAGMLGTIEFNSSTLYRYGNVAIHELQKQLGSTATAINALGLFVEAFSNSLPTGKINSFANQTLPQALLIVLREDRPINLVGAFENPIKSTEGYVDASIENLAEEYKKVQKFSKAPMKSFFVSTSDVFADTDTITCHSLEELIQQLKLTLDDLLSKE